MGSTPLSLQVSTSEAMTAQCSAPPSKPVKSACFLVRTDGRIERSTVLKSISAGQCVAYRVDELCVQADEAEFSRGHGCIASSIGLLCS